MRILEGQNVTKSFGGLAAVSNVDFHIDRGEILGLIGPNGAGKTTLFNLVSSTLPLSSGEIRFKDRKISGLKPHKICKMGIGRTFQETKVFPNMSVLQNVLVGAFFGTPNLVSGAGAAKEATEALDFVGLSAMGATPVGDLTLVNQKRVEVARALATKPELLLLDELMAGLNPAEVSEGMELVTRIRNTGITVFMVEHVMKAIMGICERIIVLHHGEKIAEGTPKEIAGNKQVIEIYLGEGAHAGG
ncbi:MAG: ABC transporter ATP-binding protein [Dehalococcoidia bacterium]|nr:MAG: ABC transporter ATP-binding protein [Dehalococcoidia bacterium]